MIIFRNKGVIDPKSITTFGVSSKENPGAIGFFGTGLKYAIAILLRHPLYDETRAMQNFLMDTIVSLGEQITGEPL